MRAWTRAERGCALAGLWLASVACGEAPEHALHDASPITTAMPDGGTEPWLPPRVTPPAPDSTELFMLSQTGLYLDIADKTLAPDLIAFAPAYPLWSDGAEKQRWLRLPAGAQIDSRDMDHWQFPVGTLAWKEFSLNGRRIETRLVMRTGLGPRDYFMGAFLWDEAESDARFVPEGQLDALGTGHDVPRVKLCFTCHDGEPGRILGFSALQLSAAVPSALLSDVPAEPLVLPGDPPAQQALGYLHANCGHCHNALGTSWPDTDLVLRSSVHDARVEDTALYRSTVGVRVSSASLPGVRVLPGDPAQSRVYSRMQSREPKIGMPPIGTEHADEQGLAAVRAFIQALSP